MKQKLIHLFILLVTLVSLLSFTSTPAHAAGTIYVNTATDDNIANALCSLREAIIAANTDAIYQGCPAGAGQDTILFNGDYTITLGSQLPAITSDIIIDGNGISLTVIQANASSNVASYRVMAVTDVGTLHLQDVTVKNGNCSSLCIGGGGIFNAGELVVSNVLLAGNNSSDGGAVYNSLDSDFYMNNSKVQYNHATNGGGIYAASGSYLEIDKSTIANNGVDNDGGGIYLDINTTMYINDSTIDGHDLSSGDGAGIYYKGGNGLLNVSNTTFSGNWASAGNGGGIYNLGDLNVRNSTFYSNLALNSGGGIFHGAPNTREMNILNSTFSENEGDLGASGIYNASGSVINQFAHNILANSNGGPDCASDGTVVNGYENVIEANGNNVSNECTSFYTIDADPMLGPLMDHGGFTPTMGLLAGSPAIDAGGCGQLTDQRGVTRPQSTNCDLGAYEKNLTFADVPFDHWAWQYVESIAYAGITGGCGGGNYCPTSSVTRGQMAVFLLKGMYGKDYIPADATGTIFNDIPANHMFAKWIEQLAAEGITGGCGGGNYCPDAPVTREQMAVFLLVAEHGTGYTPPAASGIFTDVPTSNPFASWIEQLAAEGITGGCGGGNYCPSTPVNRAQMAVFLQTTFNLVLP